MKCIAALPATVPFGAVHAFGDLAKEFRMITYPSATDEEHQWRKRRLLKGPKERSGYWR
jgi:hypothetical protein